MTTLSTNQQAPAITPDDAPPSSQPQRESLARLVLPPFVLGSIIVGAWFFVSYRLLDDKRRFLLEPPQKVWSNGFANTKIRTEMLDGLVNTGKVAMWGLTISIIIGMTTAVLMSLSKLLERAIFPFSVMLQALPILAIVPLIGFWFGYGFSSRVFIVVLISIFPIIVNTLFGLLSADQGMHDLLTLHEAGRFTRLVKVQFPAAQPAIFAGLRIAAGLSVIGAIVGDFLFGQGESGIGQLLKRYAAKLQGEALLSAVFLSCLLSVLVFLAFGWLSNRMVGKWAPSSRGKN